MTLREAIAVALIAGTVAAQLQGQSTSGTTPAPATAQAPAPAVPSTATPPSPAPDETTKPGKKKKPSSSDSIETGKPIHGDTLHAQRKAAKLYLDGVRLLEKQQPEAAWNLLKQAVELEPGDATYEKAAELARQSTVTQLVQQSSRVRNTGSAEDSAQLLHRAQVIDPTTPLVLQHLDQLADTTAATKVGATANATLGAQAGVAGHEDTDAGSPIQLEPKR